MVDKIVEEVLSIIKKEYDGKVNFGNLSVVVLRAMNIVSEVSDLPGIQKKQVVINVVSSLIEGYEGKEYIMIFLPKLIDTLVSVENDELVINKKSKEKFLGYFKSCFACF